jgi:hypothetical protein
MTRRPRAIELRNARGVVLSLSGASVGLSFDLDLSGQGSQRVQYSDSIRLCRNGGK